MRSCDAGGTSLILDELGANAAQTSMIVRSAREFDESGQWVTFDTLAYEAAERDEEWDPWTPSTMPRYLGGAWTGEAITLTALGLLAAGSAPRTAERLVQLAQISAQRKIDHREDAKLGRDILVEQYDWTRDEAARAYELFMLLPGLSGGGRGGEDWELTIFRGALQYRNVESSDDLVKVLMGLAEQDRRLFLRHRLPTSSVMEGGEFAPAVTRRRLRRWIDGQFEYPLMKYVVWPAVVAVVAGVVLLAIHR